MKRLNSKLLVLTIVFLLGIVAFQLSVHATNENIEIVQTTDDNYLIYIKDNLNTDFEFAFSNEKDADKEALDYKYAETDSEEENSNKIAFVNNTTKELFDKPTYMWAKNSEGNYIVEGIEISLEDSIHVYDLEHSAQITKIIPVDATKTNTTQKEVDGKKITTTVGKVILPETENDYSYILIKLPNSSDYDNLTNLATRISKFNSETNTYTKINVYKQFINTIEKLQPNSNSNWIKIEGNEISQPEDTADGEQYILWLKETKGNNIVKQDIQFLTSHREESEEKIKETITTKLPITYDNNTLLIVLIVLIVVAIIVFIRIKMLNKNKKEEK